MGRPTPSSAAIAYRGGLARFRGLSGGPRNRRQTSCGKPHFPINGPVPQAILPPRLTRFDGVEFLQDRFRVVLIQPDLGHGPGRAQPHGGRFLVAEQGGERVHGLRG